MQNSEGKKAAGRHGAETTSVQRRLGDKELDAGQSRGGAQGPQEGCKAGAEAAGGAGWGRPGSKRGYGRTEAQSRAGAERTGWTRRAGEEAVAGLGVWSGHTAFPGLGGARRPCAHAARGCWRGGASTHGDNEPLPRQQISLVDLDVTEVLHPALADFFKLLLVDKAQRGVKRGKALQVSPS